MSEPSEYRPGQLRLPLVPPLLSPPPVPAPLMGQEPRIPAEGAGKPGHSAPTLGCLGHTSQELTFENSGKRWHGCVRNTVWSQGGSDTVPVLRELTVWWDTRTPTGAHQQGPKAGGAQGSG